MTILITGGAGYIGSHIAVELLNIGHEVIIIDNFYNSKEITIENIGNITKKEFAFYAYDCTNENLVNRVFDQHDIDVVIHAAAEISSAKSVAEPVFCYRNNMNSLYTIINAMLNHGKTKMIFSSSATIYGDVTSVPVAESTTRSLSGSPYGVSKQHGEDVLLSISDKINSVLLRYFNPVGAHSSGLIGAMPRSGADGIASALFRAYHTKQQFKIFGDNYKTIDGTCVRDYIHIDDLVQAHVQAIKWINVNDETDYFNVCTGKGTSVKTMIDFFENIIGEKMNIAITGRRKGDLGEVVGTTDKAKSGLHFTAKKSVEEALKDSQKWYEYIFETELEMA